MNAFRNGLPGSKASIDQRDADLLPIPITLRYHEVPLPAYPRLVAPRLARELRQDPEAQKRHARRRLRSRWGLWGGLMLSALVMACSLWHDCA